MDNNRNTFLAIGLSILVIVAWQYLYVGPRFEEEQRIAKIEMERQKIQDGQEQESFNVRVPTISENPVSDNIEGALKIGGVSKEELLDNQATAQNQRIKVETESLTGSINLRGARIDDLRLRKYRETVDPESPLVRLLSPGNEANGYFAEFGFAGGKDVGGVPGPNTLWKSVSTGPIGNGRAAILSWTNSKGVIFKRKIEVDDNYMFTFTDIVENDSSQPIIISPWGRVTQLYEPKSQRIYVLHEGLIGFFNEEGLQEIDYDDIREDKELRFQEVESGWLGITDKYWATALIPNGKFDATFSFYGDRGDHFQTHFIGDALTVKPGKSKTVEYFLFAGAKETGIINEYQKNLDIFKFDFMIDWGWFATITKPLFFILDYLNKWFGNFGVAILVTTILVKILFFPLANLSYASMAKMKKLQPELTAIREQYADDRVQQQKEMMALYKKEKINPAAGCWPMLIQIPVFFALYKVIYITIELRHAPFFGWIRDLSAPDPTSIFNLFGLLPFDLPILLTIGIWPLLMGVTMFLQMRMNPAPPDATQAMIFNWMPVVFTFMLASFPAGLVIYWAWNNVLTIIQQGFIMKKHGVKVELVDNLLAIFRREKNSSV